MRLRPLLLPAIASTIVAYAAQVRAGDDEQYPTLPDFGVPAAPAPPRPPDPPSAAFGAARQVVISGGSNIGIASTEYGSSSASQLALTFDPSFDFFLVKNVSIGLSTSLSYSNSKGYGADGSLVQTQLSSVSIGPRLGINVPLGSMLSVWPMLTLAIESEHRDETVISGTSASIAGSSIPAASPALIGPSIDLYVPLLFHPGPHVFIGAGPYFFRELGSVQGGPNVGDQRTTIGGGLVMGGYFGGTPVPRAVPEDTTPGRRFGDAGEVVFTDEETLSGSYTWYAGTGASNAAFSVQLGIDYFVVDHVSCGAFGFGNYSNEVGFEPSGEAVTQVATSGGGGLRLGGDIPLTRYLSVFPRASIAFGPSSYDEKTGLTENNPTEIAGWVSLSVPLLVHASSHFFVGFGPNITHDLVASYTYPSGSGGENRATRIGAGLTVGAWL